MGPSFPQLPGLRPPPASMPRDHFTPQGQPEDRSLPWLLQPGPVPQPASMAWISLPHGSGSAPIPPPPGAPSPSATTACRQLGQGSIGGTRHPCQRLLPKLLSISTLHGGHSGPDLGAPFPIAPRKRHFRVWAELPEQDSGCLQHPPGGKSRPHPSCTRPPAPPPGWTTFANQERLSL